MLVCNSAYAVYTCHDICQNLQYDIFLADPFRVKSTLHSAICSKILLCSHHIPSVQVFEAQHSLHMILNIIKPANPLEFFLRKSVHIQSWNQYKKFFQNLLPAPRIIFAHSSFNNNVTPATSPLIHLLTYSSVTVDSSDISQSKNKTNCPLANCNPISLLELFSPP